MASLGFWEQGNEITYFKGTRDNFRINLREQAIFLQFKGTLTKYFREQWNILPGKRLSLFIVVNAVISNSNWTEWSTIQGVIARVISKSDEREARGRFEITSTITP